MKTRFVDVILVFIILFIFLFPSISPSIICDNNSNVPIADHELENLAYIYANDCGDINIDIYKHLLLNDKIDHLKIDESIRTPDSISLSYSNDLIDSSWPMKCHDNRHTSRSSVGTAGNPYGELWRYESDTWMDTSPAIGPDGIIYVGGGYGELPWYLFAIYPNGTLKWRYGTDGLVNACPAIAEDGTIYFPSWDNCLHAINPDGSRKWKYDSDSNIYSSPAIDTDGTIYIGTMLPGCEIIAVNPDGAEKWRYPTGYAITSDPVISDDGTVYIGSGDHYLYAMYPNGTLRWRYQTGDEVKGEPSIADDGTIYIGSWDGYLYALYPDGSLRWRTSIWYGTARNPSLGEDGTIYVTSSTNMFAIYPNNGTIKWDFNMIGHADSSSIAICDDGILYIGLEIGDGQGGEILAVNPDGTERWRKRIGSDWVESSPAIGEDGTVYICSSSSDGLDTLGHLYAFGDGELRSDAHGPYVGIKNEPVTFTGSVNAGHPPYSYYWDFGDTETSDEQNPTHIYEIAGNHTVTFTVTDDNESVAVDTTWALIRESNDPPEIPSIEGETEGHYDEIYEYTFNTTDVDGDDIMYYVEWGDGINSGWSELVSSGQEIILSHIWRDKDTFTIRAKAKDYFGLESDWAYLEVTMPVNQPPQFPIISWLMERFPNMFPIIRIVLEQ
jgi:outer membrane protein assembly factor BamB